MKLSDLISTLNHWEDGDFLVDFDKLMALGIKHGRLAGVDIAVLDWLAAHPTNRRLDITCAFLSGRWSLPAEGNAVRRLLALARSVAATDEVKFALAMALSQIIRHGQDDADLRLMQVLRAMLDDARDPEFRSRLQELIESLGVP